jgi:hypothetical protein
MASGACIDLLGHQPPAAFTTQKATNGNVESNVRDATDLGSIKTRCESPYPGATRRVGVVVAIYRKTIVVSCIAKQMQKKMVTMVTIRGQLPLHQQDGTVTTQK